MNEGKSQTFSIKQITDKNGSLLYDVLSKLLLTTSPDAQDANTRQSLLEYASLNNNLPLVKFLYRHGANLTRSFVSGDTAMNVAARTRNYRLMELLRIYGVRMNQCDSDGRSPLHVCASLNDVDGICRVVEWGGEVNIRDNHNRTPLHFAAASGHFEACELLLQLGADLNCRDSKELTAVSHAELNDHFQLVDRLLSFGGVARSLTSAAVTMDQGHSWRKHDQLKLSGGPQMGQISVNPSYLRKTTHLARLGVVPSS